MTDEKIKQHNFLKILIIFVSLIMVFALNFLSMFIVKDKNSFSQVMLANLIEIAFLSGIIFLWSKVLPKMFPATNTFRFKKVSFDQIMMILGIALLNLIGVYRLLYLIRGNVEMAPVVYESKTEFREDILASFHAVWIAPVLEEMGFRIIPASVVQTKKRRIITLIILALFFAVVHPRNILAVLVDATILCVLFLVTRNPISSILYHAFGNLLKTIAYITSYYGIIDVSTSFKGGTIKLFSNRVTIIGLVIGSVLILPAIIVRTRRSLK